MTIREMVEGLALGAVSLDEAVATVKATPPVPARVRSPAAQVAADAVGDYDLPDFPDDSFQHVYFAYTAGRITAQQYRALFAAAVR